MSDGLCITYVLNQRDRQLEAKPYRSASVTFGDILHDFIQDLAISHEKSRRSTLLEILGVGG